MGIINGVAEKGLSAVGLGGVFKRNVKPQGYAADFPGGLIIEEFIDGRPSKEANGKITLIGSFMPLVPFEHGGKQQIVKDFYPGNSEPVLQMLGPREDNVTIRGSFKTKRFDLNGPNAFPNANLAAYQYQELINDMRTRGNVVKMTLGQWKRYGVIEDTSFKMTKLSQIDYSITFSIIGKNLPKNQKIIDGADDDLEGPKTEITDGAALALSQSKNYPDTMPRTLSEFLDDAIDTVASAISLVTDFVDSALRDIENISASANRAIGLIKNARANISRFSRRIGQIQMTPANLASGVTSAGFKTAATFNNAAHLQRIKNDYGNLAKMLAALQARFAAMAKTVPIRRHLVKKDETLQGLAIKYYNNADLWKSIYDHNKLSTPALVVGSVLEIPRP